MCLAVWVQTPIQVGLDRLTDLLIFFFSDVQHLMCQKNGFSLLVSPTHPTPVLRYRVFLLVVRPHHATTHPTPVLRYRVFLLVVRSYHAASPPFFVIEFSCKWSGPTTLQPIPPPFFVAYLPLPPPPPPPPPLPSGLMLCSMWLVCVPVFQRKRHLSEYFRFLTKSVTALRASHLHPAVITHESDPEGCPSLG